MNDEKENKVDTSPIVSKLEESKELLIAIYRKTTDTESDRIGKAIALINGAIDNLVK